MGIASQREAISWWSATRRTAPLAAANQTIDSDWIQVRLYPVEAGATTIPVYHDRRRLTGSVVTDQASAANGFQIHFSNRADHTDSFIGFQAGLAANVPQSFDVAISGKWVRIELANGAVAQTTLSLAAYLEDD